MDSPIRTFYIGCSGKSWLYAAQLLKQEANWEPLYWVGSKSDEADIRKISPRVVFHELISAVRGINPLREPEIQSGTIDEPLLLDLSQDQNILTKMMDRMDPGDAFDYGERVAFYHSLLRYWLGVIAKFRPQLIVFPESPHMVFDYVLYALCKKLLVPTAMFESVLAVGWIMPMDSVEDGCTVIRDEYLKRLTSVTADSAGLSQFVLDYVSRLRGAQNDAVPTHVKNAIEEQTRPADGSTLEGTIQKLGLFYKYPHYLKQAVFGVRHAVDRFRHYLLDPAPPNYLKQKGKGVQTSKMTGLQWRNYKRAANRFKRQLKQEYENLAGDVGFDRNYIFVALQYQPEKTSSPDGGVFVYQELMIQMLSSCVPNDWYVYVKENPGQFGKWHGERSREKNYYRSLIDVSKIRLVPMGIPTYDMIDGCMAVATVRGTAGWEGILRGKPALLFGKPWYQGCEGTFEVRSLDKLKTALRIIERGYLLDQKKVSMFLQAAEDTAARGFVGEKYGLALGISTEENGRTIARTLQNHMAPLLEC